MVATSVSGAVQPAVCSHAPNLSTTKAVKRAPTVARGPTPCGAPHGDRGNGLEFPVSVPLLYHEEFPILQAQDGFDTREAARTVSGGSIHAVISAMCEDAPNLFSNGSDQRAPAMAREPTACGARWGKYSGYATLRKIPNVCSDNTSRNPLDKRPQPIQVIFLSGSRNRSYIRNFLLSQRAAAPQKLNEALGR